MFIKQNILKKSRYIILTDTSSIYDILLEQKVNNIALYDNIDFDDSYIKALLQKNKVLLINNKDHYNKLQEVLKEKIIFLKLPNSTKNYNNKIMSTLYNNTNLINTSQYKKEYTRKPTYIPTGFDIIDYALNDLQTGRFYIITGFTGQGKSAFVDLIQINAIENKVRTLVLDGEHSREEKINNYQLKLMGKYPDFVIKEKENKREVLKINEDGENIIRLWEQDYLFLYNSVYEKKKKLRDELFDIVQNLITLEGIKLVIIDNIMSLNVIDNVEKNEAQKEFVENCRMLAKNLGVCVVLVAHPRKPSKGEVVSEYDISGSSDIPNSVDGIIRVSKSTEEERLLNIHGHIEIQKNRIFSEFPKNNTYYDFKTKCLYEIQDNNVKKKRLPRLEEIIKNYNGNIKEEDLVIKEIPF